MLHRSMLPLRTSSQLCYKYKGSHNKRSVSTTKRSTRAGWKTYAQRNAQLSSKCQLLL